MITLVFLLSFCFLLSSVGLAKAALEAINGFNLFGNQVIKMFVLSFFFFLAVMIYTVDQRIFRKNLDSSFLDCSFKKS